MTKDRAYYEQFLTNTNVVAYLNAISKVESPTYYTANGGSIYVPTSAAHPDRIFAGGKSAAFGRYQFMPDTWQRINNAIGPLDIRKPRDQDIAAMWLLDQARGTFNDVVAGNCIATLDNNSWEWAALPNSSSQFRYGGQGSKYDAQGFCNLVKSLNGTTLPEGPLVNNNAPNLLPNSSNSTAPTSPFAGGGANFSDINCPPIKEEDLYRANFQITNPGCKISGPVQPITGSSTNGGTVNNSNVTNNSVGFSLNTQGFGACSSLRNPCKPGYVFTSGFGPRWGRNHNGVDLAADTGTPIFAASNGVVDYAGWNDGGFGNLVIIISPEKIETKYAHLNAIKCKVGQQVQVGQQIGDMGSTGFSTGPHLHFEVRLDGLLIDPATCIKF